MGKRYVEKGVNKVFVYGALMKDFPLHDIYAFDASMIRKGYVDGELYDFGDYPVLVWGESIVYGELLEFDDIDKALMRLDELEGYNGEGGDNYFERILVER